MPFTPENKNLLSTWVDTYSKDLFSWACYKTSDQSVAEDLVQDTFLAACQAMHTFEGKSNAKTWLFSILNNKIADHHRKQFRNPVSRESLQGREAGKSLMDKLFDENGEWRIAARPAAWDIQEEQLLDQTEFNRVLQHCFEKLPPDWSSAVQLKYLEEQDGKKICQDLGITASNFWQILHRAKLQLRACLELNWFKP